MMKTHARYNFIKKLCAALTAFFLLWATPLAYASVLGEPTSERSRAFALGTVVHTNTFQDSTVGQQTEHYVHYVPSDDVTPILTNGASVYGKRTLKQANELLKSQDINTAVGINADFFSLQTGVPMSNVVIDSKVVSKDDADLPAIGFFEDGTAFISTLPIESTLKTPTGNVTVECINKYRQPYALYLYTEDFGEETYAPDSGINIVLKNVSGDITLDSKITAVVESIEETEGSVPIPQGKWVLSVSSDAEESIRERVSSLNIGTRVTLITNQTSGDSRWKNAVYGLGALGGRLITDGKLTVEDESAAPRTAIGIKKDGSILFYTIDGRQSGYSYGVRKETLAKRLLELGCVDAINLDGGGSTSLGGTLPGTYDFAILNSPSDGALRSCANFIFLKKNTEPDGVPYVLDVSNWGSPILSGSSVQLSVVGAYDKSYGPADIPENIVFSLAEDAHTASPDGKKTQVSASGYVTARGNGDIYIEATDGKVKGNTMLRVVATPENLKIYRKDSGAEVTELTPEKGESLSLTATAFWDNQSMIVDNDSFTWRVISDDASIGTIDEKGNFTASENAGATGIIGVNAGLCTYEIPVAIPPDEVTPLPVAFPQIAGRLTDTAFLAEVTSQNGTLEKVTLSIDGKAVKASYDALTQTLSYTFPKNFTDVYHRLLVTATDETGASAMAAFDTSTLTGQRTFPDTRAHWAKQYIGYLSTCGVVKGSDDGNFYPDNPMTRTEFAIMLCNYLDIRPEDYADVELPFTDAGDIPWWAENQVKAIYALGIMKGQLTDYGVAFSPNSNIQRLEYAISIERLLPTGLAKAPIVATDAEDIPWWGLESMKLATAQKILNGYPDGSLKPRQSVTRAEAVKILYTVFGAGK